MGHPESSALLIDQLILFVIPEGNLLLVSMLFATSARPDETTRYSESMRIATWNCQMGFGNKFEALLSLNPDITVVPECSEKSIDYLKRLGYGALWFGSNPLKGLGVFCRKDWSLRALPQPSQNWIVPIEVDAPTPFTLIAVWACQVGTKRADHYIGQVHQAITSHQEWFGRGPLVIAGDLNSNKKWDSERKVGNHSEVVKILSELGLVRVII